MSIARDLKLTERVTDALESLRTERVTDAELAEAATLYEAHVDRAEPIGRANGLRATLLAKKFAAELARWRAPVDVEATLRAWREDAAVSGWPITAIDGLESLIRPHVTREAALAREVASLRVTVSSLREHHRADHEALAVCDARDVVRERDEARANLEALREGARAVEKDATRADQGDAPGYSHVSTRLLAALRAELDHPTGGALTAERDAWRALARASGRLVIIERVLGEAGRGGPSVKMLDGSDPWKARDTANADALAAKAALRALGIDPDGES